MWYIHIIFAYYMVCVTCMLIEQLVPARPQKKLKKDILHITTTDFP